MTQSAEDDDPRMDKARARLGTLLQEKWTLDSLLGAGGMAAVYGATHRNGKRVAIKMLHSELSHDEEIKRRFLHEGYAANAIQHDGAVSVLDDDVAPDGSAFIVMELLEGETVERRWERAGGRMPVGDALAITDGLLDVLAAAHDKSVVHRDIKPENVFITKAGAVKVLDFGIAKVFEERQAGGTSTRAGTIMGTPAFMAPEQALARWDQVDGRTDLWAVGAMLFTLLTGRHVHEAPSNQEQLIRSATTPAPPLKSVAPDTPEDVAGIVDRALAFEMNARWGDARAMQAAVRAALEARGGSKPLDGGGRGTGTLLSRGQVEDPAHPRAATMIDTTRTASSLAAWTREREVRIAEAAKLRTSITELQEKANAAKRAVAETQAKVEVARAERASLEQWFKRQSGTRTAAVEEARAVLRRKMVAVAERALEDQKAFGAEFDPSRREIATLRAAARSAERDVAVHVAALDAYDPPSLRSGVILLGVVAVLALAMLLGPIVWRATRVVDPGPPLPAHGATTSH